MVLKQKKSKKKKELVSNGCLLTNRSQGAKRKRKRGTKNHKMKLKLTEKLLMLN